MRLSYPSNVKVVKLPCTGRADVGLILKAFESGVDGVYLAGCLEGECHYLRGNLRAKSRLSYASQLSEKIGLEKERLEFCHLATNCGVKFAETLQRKSEALKKLGPNPGKQT